MARRPSLSADPLPKRRTKATKDAPSTAKTVRPPSRQNRRCLTLWIAPEAKELLREIGYEHRLKEQALGEEALDLLFAHYGKHRIASIKDDTST